MVANCSFGQATQQTSKRRRQAICSYYDVLKLGECTSYVESNGTPVVGRNARTDLFLKISGIRTPINYIVLFIIDQQNATQPYVLYLSVTDSCVGVATSEETTTSVNLSVCVNRAL